MIHPVLLREAIEAGLTVSFSSAGVVIEHHEADDGFPVSKRILIFKGATLEEAWRNWRMHNEGHIYNDE